MNRRELLRAGASLGVIGAVGQRTLAGTPWPAPLQPEAHAPDSEILLCWNENPLGPAPEAKEAVRGAIAAAHRYPDAARTALEERLAVSAGLDREHVVLGAGSTEILQMVVQAAFAPKATLMVADPTFGAVADYQRPLAYRMEKVPLDSTFAHDIGRMRDLASARGGPVVVYLCNPNNPTGTLTPSAAIDAWIEEAPGSVLFAVDEAYHEYVEAPEYESAVKWVRRRPNVVVVRTFSKIYGMAGLRLGYAFAHPQTAGRLRQFMSSDNANAMALAAAAASLGNKAHLNRSRQANGESLRIVRRCLEELEVGYLPTHANFLMHRIPGEGSDYIGMMRRRGFLVGRPFPPLLSYNRISMGLPEEMERVAEAWRELRATGQL